MVKPIFFMKKQLTAIAALYNMALVGFLGVLHKLVVAPKSRMAIVTF